MERNVVVLPQPDGPSSVNSLPSGTSNETSCAALTTAPRSLAYSVFSDLILSTFVPLCCSLPPKGGGSWWGSRSVDPHPIAFAEQMLSTSPFQGEVTCRTTLFSEQASLRAINFPIFRISCPKTERS